MTLRTVTAAILATILLIGGDAQSVLADEPRPAIERVQLSVDRGYIVGDVTSSGLFSERITGTVQSGLPAVADLFYYFSAFDGSIVAENVLSFSLRYDVWEDFYSIVTPDTTLFFETFSGLQETIENLDQLKLISLGLLEPDRSYRVHMSIAITPLQGVDRDKITGWMDQNMQTSEDNSWHGQMLNLNELISHFFSSEQGIVNRSSWYRSALIKPDSLSGQSQEKK